MQRVSNGRTQKMKCLHVLRQLFNTPYTIVYNTFPLLQLASCHGAVCEKKRITRVLLYGLRIVPFFALIVSILKAIVVLRLELFIIIFVACWWYIDD